MAKLDKQAYLYIQKTFGFSIFRDLLGDSPKTPSPSQMGKSISLT